MANKLPLFIVTGASGSGKTHVVPELRKKLPDFDIFDTDQLISIVGQEWDTIRQIWLRVARNIAASGRMTILCGTMMPWDIERCVDFACFKRVYYINLHCKAETRENRLRERDWPEERIREHIHFAQRLLEIADTEFDPPMPTIDTTSDEVDAVASRIREWVLGCSEDDNFPASFSRRPRSDFATSG